MCGLPLLFQAPREEEKTERESRREKREKLGYRKFWEKPGIIIGI